MFPTVEGSAFDNNLDAAFEAEDGKAYLFKGTKFEDGIGAAFVSHKKGQACLFQEDYYTLVDFENNHIIEPVDKI
ncbi:hypothetical protein SLA2020_214740 [Shorea laevis]